MVLKDEINKILDEYKQLGNVAIPVRNLVERLVKDTNYKVSSIYNALKEMEMKGEIKVLNRSKRKLIVLKEE